MKENETQNADFIIDTFIPVGHENAITREMLTMKTGISDRLIRRAIAESDAPIINTGEGYYTPNMEDPVDVANLRAYVLQEQARVQSLQDKIRSKFAEYAPDLIPTEEEEAEREI